MAGSNDALIDRLNRLDKAEFVETIGFLYEHSPWIARAGWGLRPFTDRGHLMLALRSVVQDASPAQQVSLILAHPDLGGRLARSSDMAPASQSEQLGLGLDRLGDEEFERFDTLNKLYRERFGFPFIIAVRAQTRDSVLACLAARVLNDLETERRTALDEIHRIAGFRLQDL